MRQTSRYLEEIKYGLPENCTFIGGTTPSMPEFIKKRVDSLSLIQVESKRSGLCEELKETLSNLTKISPPNIGLFPGATQAFFQVLASISAPGDLVVFEKPYYEPFLASANALGLRTKCLNMDEVKSRNSDFSRDILVLTHPNCFSGGLRKISEINQLTPLFSKIIVDEIYLPLSNDSFSVSSSLDLEKFSFVGGLSKISGCSYARIGWALGSPSVLKQAERFGLHLHTDLATTSVQVGLEVLRDFKNIKDEILCNIADSWAKLKFLNNGPLRSKSGSKSYFWSIDTPKDFPSSQDFLQFLMAEGVYLVPGHHFGDPSKMRMSVFSTTDSAIHALKRIETFYA